MLYVYYNDDAFLEIAECLHQSLTKLHVQSQLLTRINPMLTGEENLFIMLGLNNETPILPERYIAYQLEQTGNQQSWFSATYLAKLREAVEIWDYSIKNIQNLKIYQPLPSIRYVPMGYSPCLRKIMTPAPEKKYDILFYGSACPRRDQIIRSLRAAKFRVYYGEYSLWGEERDRLISESKIILNLHYYPKPILETARLIYLIANQAFVISEPSSDPILDKDFQQYVVFSESQKLVETCRYYLEHSEERQKFAREAHLKFMDRDYTQFIPDPATFLHAQPLNLSSSDSHPSNNSNSNQSHPSPDEGKGNIRPKFKQAEVEITSQGEILKTGNSLSADESNYPRVSLVTPTAGRTWALTTLALRNFYSFIYPADKLEWIILDSDPTEPVNLPTDPRIKYSVVDKHIPLWKKRNLCNEQATGDIIIHLDDDDYYLPTSILAKVKLLNRYWSEGIECVGCTELGIYHLLENYSYLASTKYISEASMAYNRVFWKEQPFQGTNLEMGEGYSFLKGREQQVVNMPYSFNFIALTHGSNTTGALRTIKTQHSSLHYDNFFNMWDRDTQFFFMELRNKVEQIQNPERKRPITQKRLITQKRPITQKRQF